MSQNYSRSLLRISVAQICQNLGWNSAQSSSLEVMTDVLERYLTQLGGICHRYSEQFGRTQPNLDDLGLAFKHMGINIGELEDYVKHVDPVPFAHDVVAFPARKTPSLGFPNPRSREILQQREEHVDDHLPYMYPNMKDEVPEQRPKSPIVTNDSIVPKTEPVNDESATNGEVAGEKRNTPMASTDVPPIKRQRVGNSLFTDEAGHSQYEMKCVYMGANGVLTARPGCQGKQPEPRLPPPNPRNISENNKENKNKEATNGIKGSNSIGGIGVDGLKEKKSSKKSLLKKNAHDKSSKLTLELSGKDIGKKSASSKAAAKFIKKLKSSKKSAKLFGKSKSKDKELKKYRDDPEDEGMKENVRKSRLDKAQKGMKKKRKEKKSAAILDFDEELRNLSSPSSSPSGDRSSTHEGDGSKKKARMEAIDDSINSVLREGTDGSGKGKKKKKDMKVEDGSVKSKDGGNEKMKDKLKKQKANKANRKSKDKKPEPPPIDIKPFVSEKYSSAELMVYEFNDSPPDANSVKSRRPSAPDGNSPPHQTTTHSPAPKSSSSHSHHKVKHIEPEEELFAPEIKIESRSDLTVKPLKLDLSKEKDKEKHKSKDDRREKNDEERQKARDDKSSKVKDKKDKYREDEKFKDRFKDKDIRKEKKDKKKDKEKKKKHKEKDRDREKDKEKKREDKIKQEARESRESSPVIGMGVKLKIKIGGSTGPTSSMMVTGENSSPDRASPVPPKRESMSPPKVPRLFISKEKNKKGKHNKGKASPVTMAVKSRSSSPASNAPSRDRTPPSKNPSPTPSRKTPTPPPRAISSSPQPKGSEASDTKKYKSIKDKPGRLSRKDKGKKRGPKPAANSPTKSSTKLRHMPSRASHISSSPEHSPYRRSSKSPSASPSSLHPSPSSSLSRQKITLPPPISPAGTSSRTGSGSTTSSRKQPATRASSQSPSRPPTPGSTSPAASPEWNYPMLPSHPSPTPPPRTPTGSPRHAASPSHSSPPRTPNADRSLSPPLPPSPHDTPKPADTPATSKSSKEYSSSSVALGKSAASAAKNRTIEAETVCVFFDDSGQKVWICPACKSPDDGSEMIGCDSCDNWYHWICVNITQAPPEEQQWFCGPCLIKNKSAAKGSRGRGRPRGRGRGRGRKKIT